MPVRYYAKSLFLSVLVFCRNHDVHVRFVSQFKRLLRWLVHVFFAASIGFQVPLKDFAVRAVIAYGALFTLVLTGKLAGGFLVPNFNNSEKVKGLHMRDYLITWCSMVSMWRRPRSGPDAVEHALTRPGLPAVLFVLAGRRGRVCVRDCCVCEG